MFRSLPSLLAASILSIIAPVALPRAQAAYENYNSVLLGERAAGMGGAFTALSGDSAATPFYNPATTVLQSGSSLSATANVYNKYVTSIGQSGDADGAPGKLNRGFFRAVPSSSATILNFKSFAVGLSVLVPDYEAYSGQIRGSETTVSTLNMVDESLWVGATFSGRLTERDSIGLSLYYTARNLSRSANDRVTTGGGTGAIITSEETNLTANNVVPILGLHRKLSETWSAGLSLRPKSIPIAGEASYYKSITVTSPYTQNVINRPGSRAVTMIPSRIAFGVAREVADVNTISFDISIFGTDSYRDMPEVVEGAAVVRHKRTVNFALGYEQSLNSWLNLRMGLFTNRSSLTSPDASANYRQGDKVDMNGASLNFNILTKKETSFTVGGYYSGGSGTSTQLVDQSVQIVPKSQKIFTMLLATGFHF
jgi:hypothetical protein